MTADNRIGCQRVGVHAATVNLATEKARVAWVAIQSWELPPARRAGQRIRGPYR
jgi:hypothetical protein